MSSPRNRARLDGLERLEDRDQPAAGLLADLNLASADSFSLPYGTYSAATPSGAVLGNSVIFSPDDGVHTASVWKSDGTDAGTKLITTLPTTSTDAILPPWLRPSNFTTVGNQTFFSYDDGTHSNMLWVTDGTAAGTHSVGSSGLQYPGQFGIAGGRLVFSASTSGFPGTSLPGLYTSDGTSAGTTLLRDFSNSSITSLNWSGGKLYYTTLTVDPVTSLPGTSTIWSSDGTVAGTKKLVDLPTGLMPGTPYGSSPWLTAVGNKLYFSASRADVGVELWVTDGTTTGTRLVKDINTSAPTPLPLGIPGASQTLGNASSFPQQLTVIGNTLYFAADDGIHGQELWKTDGTASGTTMVMDISPTVAASPTFPNFPGYLTGSQISGLQAVGGKLYFSTDDGVHGSQLYTSDGTAAGTTPLTSVEHGASEFPAPAAILSTSGGRIFFAIDDTTNGRQLWVTNGTKAGTTLVKPIGVGSNSSAQFGPAPIGVLGGRLLFNSDDGVNGRQLWVTDGSAANTTMVARLNVSNLGSGVGGIVSLGTTALFTGFEGQNAAAVIYATDGKSAPRVVKRFANPLTDAAGQPTGGIEYPEQLTRSGTLAYFVSSAGAAGSRLWVTDGTTAGTRILKTVPPPSDQPVVMFSAGITNLTDVAGTLYFTIDRAGFGQQLWKTDGTAAGTTMVKQLNPKSTSELSPYIGLMLDPAAVPIHQLTAVGATLYFAATDAAGGSELWVSDGTSAGTRMVKDIRPGTTGSVPTNLAAFQGKLYFLADDGTGRKLWVSDGTAGGTKIAASVGLDGAYPSSVGPTVTELATRNLVVAGGKLFFTAWDNAGHQLWATDGTVNGTKRLTQIVTGLEVPGQLGDPGISGLTAAGSKLYFTSRTTGGWQLYASDGTAAGTRAVTTLPFAGDAPTPLLAVGDRLLFIAADATHGRELWMTDGTVAGTKMIQDIAGGPRSSQPLGQWPAPSAAIVGNRVLFAADDGLHGLEPWTLPVSDVFPVPVSPPPVVPPVTTPPVKPPIARATVTGVFAINVGEGVTTTATLATVNLPDGPTYRVTVFWGDGRTSVGTLTRTTGTAFSLSAEHQFPYPGNYSILVRVTADNKTVLSIDTTAAVADARFYVGRVAQRLPAGQEFFGVVATIQDMNPAGGRAADFTASIDWGDGQTSMGVVRKTAAGKFEIVGRHTFNRDGKGTATVTIHSVGGPTVTAVSLFTIDAAKLPKAA